MIDAVFISDLHLHPDMPDISKRFEAFLDWAWQHTRTLYILGDFFHVWAGDDVQTAFSHKIATRLRALSDAGMSIYFMRGNRDFLLGTQFLAAAGLKEINEPKIIALGDEHILLVHGDKYCTEDKAHQWFRRFTRNRWFPWLFLKVPKKIRGRIVSQVRAHSANNTKKSRANMDVVPRALGKDLKRRKVHTVIHGHTHKPGLTKHNIKGTVYQQYVLSDWDASPSILCYNKPKGFYFELPIERV